MKISKNQISHQELLEKIKKLTATEIAENPYYKMYRNGILTYIEFLEETLEMLKESK